MTTRLRQGISRRTGLRLDETTLPNLPPRVNRLRRVIPYRQAVVVVVVAVRRVPVGHMLSLGYQKQQGEVYQQLLQTPAPTHKTTMPETPAAPLTGNSQSFGRVLTIVGADCALLECDGHIRLLALPVAERWLRQAQLTPAQGPVCAQPLLIPLRLKVTDDEKTALEKAQSQLAELGIEFQLDAQHVTIRAVPLPLRQQNLQILIPELIGYWRCSPYPNWRYCTVDCAKRHE